MAEVRNGQSEYGVRHVMEDEQRAEGHGVFETLVGEQVKQHREAKTAKRPVSKKTAPVGKGAKVKGN